MSGGGDRRRPSSKCPSLSDGNAEAVGLQRGSTQLNEGYIPVVKGDLWENLPFTLDFQHENRHLARGFQLYTSTCSV